MTSCSAPPRSPTPGYAYRSFERIFGTESPRWDALHHAGAHPQRPLWASTGVKNPAYKDTMYVDDLVAAHTVNTMPLATLEAVADHGTVSGPTAKHNPDATLEALARAGIDLDEVTDELLDAGVEQFEDAMSRLLEGIDQQRSALRGAGLTATEPAGPTDLTGLDNPLSLGLERLPVHPTSLVIFGATGDLAHRKLLPALYNLAHEGQLPERFEMIGVGRRTKEDEEFRDTLTDSVRRYSRRRPDDRVLERPDRRHPLRPGLVRR